MELSHMNNACLQKAENLGHFATENRGIKVENSKQTGIQIEKLLQKLLFNKS